MMYGLLRCSDLIVGRGRGGRIGVCFIGESGKIDGVQWERE